MGKGEKAKNTFKSALESSVRSHRKYSLNCIGGLPSKSMYVNIILGKSEKIAETKSSREEIAQK